MRRLASLKTLTAALLLSGALAHAQTALATGGPPGGFVIPAGATASFTGAEFSACNSLSWGYQLNGGPNQVQATKPYGCFATSAPDVTIGPFATPTTLRVFMTDNTCGFTYYSDGLPVDHVIVEGSNPYSLRFADGGFFCERTLTTTNDFGGFNFRVDLSIGPATDEPISAAGGFTFSGTEPAAVSGTVATFTDPDAGSTAGEYNASIDWGDGSPATPGTVSGPMGGPFDVSGSHTYADEGSYLITVTISDTDNASNTATVMDSATVADAALSGSGLPLIVSPATYAGPVATFTDANTTSTTADFTATIDWGDGSPPSSGTVSGGGGSYTVSGSHTYGSLGSFTIKVHVVDDGGSIADARTPILIFGAVAGGNFVIGDENASVDTAVTFWGAQWSKLNSLSGGAAPAAFKGFEDTPASVTCGTTWSTDTGNSTPPPLGPLPAFMAVIVSSSVTQSGSTISGNTPHMVVVKTNAGYAPDPGHAGTGTVVAEIC